MVKDKPKPRNQTRNFKVDWCLETDYSCSSMEGHARCIFRGRKNAFDSGFLMTATWGVCRFRDLFGFGSKKRQRSPMVRTHNPGAQCQRNLES